MTSYTVVTSQIDHGGLPTVENIVSNGDPRCGAPIVVRDTDPADILKDVLLDKVVVGTTDPDSVDSRLRRTQRQPTDCDVGSANINDVGGSPVVDQQCSRASRRTLRANCYRRRGGSRSSNVTGIRVRAGCQDKRCPRGGSVDRAAPIGGCEIHNRR